MTMAKNQNNATATATQRPDIESTLSARPDAAGVLYFLWEKVAPRLTESELAGLAGASLCVSESLDLTADMLGNIAGVFSEDEGDRRDGKRVAPRIDTTAILWPLIEQLQTLSALAVVADDATSRLLRPSLCREGGALHAMDQRQMASGG